MSEVAGGPAVLAGSRRFAGVALGRSQRWRRPPEWLWGLSVVLQVASAAALTGYTFFFVDDFLFMGQARTQAFDLTYLREPLFEHFSPISRVLDRLLVTVAPGSFAFAHGIELALYAAAIGAFAFVVRAILGNGWGAFGLTVLFGQSIFLMRLLNWWTATANILPSSVFMLLALWCYLRWREVGSRRLLVGSLAAYAVSLLDYETAILFPAYVALISGLVLERRPGMRSWVALAVRERWAWTGYIVLDVAALINYYSFYYYPATRPSLHELVSYLIAALFGTFVPAVVGIKYAVDPAGHTLVIVAACVVVGAAIAVTLYLRPRAWRCLAAFVLVFLITMLPVGLTRVARFGVSEGYVIYYEQSLQFMFLVLAAFALSPRWSGRREPGVAGRLHVVRRRLPAIRVSRGRAATVAGTAALAAYAALYLTSLGAMSAASWQPRQDGAYVHQFLAGVARIRRATGREPVLVDLRVPKQVLPVKLWPYTTYGDFFAVFDSRVRAGEVGSRLYVVGRYGHLIGVRFEASTTGLIRRARTSATSHPAGARAASIQASAACVPGRRAFSWLRMPLAHPEMLRPQKSGLPYALRVHYRLPTDSRVIVQLLAAGTGLPFGTATHGWQRGTGGRLVPLGFSGVLGAVAIRLPAGACVADVTLGRLRFVH